MFSASQVTKWLDSTAMMQNIPHWTSQTWTSSSGGVPSVQFTWRVSSAPSSHGDTKQSVLRLVDNASGQYQHSSICLARNHTAMCMLTATASGGKGLLLFLLDDSATIAGSIHQSPCRLQWFVPLPPQWTEQATHITAIDLVSSVSSASSGEDHWVIHLTVYTTSQQTGADRQWILTNQLPWRRFPTDAVTIVPWQLSNLHPQSPLAESLGVDPVPQTSDPLFLYPYSDRIGTTVSTQWGAAVARVAAGGPDEALQRTSSIVLPRRASAWGHLVLAQPTTENHAAILVNVSSASLAITLDSDKGSSVQVIRCSSSTSASAVGIWVGTESADHKRHQVFLVLPLRAVGIVQLVLGSDESTSEAIADPIMDIVERTSDVLVLTQAAVFRVPLPEQIGELRSIRLKQAEESRSKLSRDQPSWYQVLQQSLWPVWPSRGGETKQLQHEAVVDDHVRAISTTAIWVAAARAIFSTDTLSLSPAAILDSFSQTLETWFLQCGLATGQLSAAFSLPDIQQTLAVQRAVTGMVASLCPNELRWWLQQLVDFAIVERTIQHGSGSGSGSSASSAWLQQATQWPLSQWVRWLAADHHPWLHVPDALWMINDVSTLLIHYPSPSKQPEEKKVELEGVQQARQMVASDVLRGLARMVLLIWYLFGAEEPLAMETESESKRVTWPEGAAPVIMVAEAQSGVWNTTVRLHGQDRIRQVVVTQTDLMNVARITCMLWKLWLVMLTGDQLDQLTWSMDRESAITCCTVTGRRSTPSNTYSSIRIRDAWPCVMPHAILRLLVPSSSTETTSVIDLAGGELVPVPMDRLPTSVDVRDMRTFLQSVCEWLPAPRQSAIAIARTHQDKKAHMAYVWTRLFPLVRQWSGTTTSAIGQQRHIIPWPATTVSHQLSASRSDPVPGIPETLWISPAHGIVRLVAYEPTSWTPVLHAAQEHKHAVGRRLASEEPVQWFYTGGGQPDRLPFAGLDSGTHGRQLATKVLPAARVAVLFPSSGSSSSTSSWPWQQAINYSAAASHQAALLVLSSAAARIIVYPAIDWHPLDTMEPYLHNRPNDDVAIWESGGVSLFRQQQAATAVSFGSHGLEQQLQLPLLRAFRLCNSTQLAIQMGHTLPELQQLWQSKTTPSEYQLVLVALSHVAGTLAINAPEELISGTMATQAITASVDHQQILLRQIAAMIESAWVHLFITETSEERQWAQLLSDATSPAGAAAELEETPAWQNMMAFQARTSRAMKKTSIRAGPQTLAELEAEEEEEERKGKKRPRPGIGAATTATIAAGETQKVLKQRLRGALTEWPIMDWGRKLMPREWRTEERAVAEESKDKRGGRLTPELYVPMGVQTARQGLWLDLCLIALRSSPSTVLGKWQTRHVAVSQENKRLEDRFNKNLQQFYYHRSVDAARAAQKEEYERKGSKPVVGQLLGDPSAAASTIGSPGYWAGVLQTNMQQSIELLTRIRNTVGEKLLLLFQHFGRGEAELKQIKELVLDAVNGRVLDPATWLTAIAQVSAKAEQPESSVSTWGPGTWGKHLSFTQELIRWWREYTMRFLLPRIDRMGGIIDQIAQRQVIGVPEAAKLVQSDEFRLQMLELDERQLSETIWAVQLFDTANWSSRNLKPMRDPHHEDYPNVAFQAVFRLMLSVKESQRLPGIVSQDVRINSRDWHELINQRLLQWHDYLGMLESPTQAAGTAPPAESQWPWPLLALAPRKAARESVIWTIVSMAPFDVVIPPNPWEQTLNRVTATRKRLADDRIQGFAKTIEFFRKKIEQEKNAQRALQIQLDSEEEKKRTEEQAALEEMGRAVEGLFDPEQDQAEAEESDDEMFDEHEHDSLQPVIALPQVVLPSVVDTGPTSMQIDPPGLEDPLAAASGESKLTEDDRVQLALLYGDAEAAKEAIPFPVMQKEFTRQVRIKRHRLQQPQTARAWIRRHILKPTFSWMVERFDNDSIGSRRPFNNPTQSTILWQRTGPLAVSFVAADALRQLQDEWTNRDPSAVGERDDFEQAELERKEAKDWGLEPPVRPSTAMEAILQQHSPTRWKLETIESKYVLMQSGPKRPFRTLFNRARQLFPVSKLRQEFSGRLDESTHMRSEYQRIIIFLQQFAESEASKAEVREWLLSTWSSESTRQLVRSIKAAVPKATYWPGERVDKSHGGSLLTYLVPWFLQQQQQQGDVGTIGSIAPIGQASALGQLLSVLMPPHDTWVRLVPAEVDAAACSPPELARLFQWRGTDSKMGEARKAAKAHETTIKFPFRDAKLEELISKALNRPQLPASHGVRSWPFAIVTYATPGASSTSSSPQWPAAPLPLMPSAVWRHQFVDSRKYPAHNGAIPPSILLQLPKNVIDQQEFFAFARKGKNWTTHGEHYMRADAYRDFPLSMEPSDFKRDALSQKWTGATGLPVVFPADLYLRVVSGDEKSPVAEPLQPLLSERPGATVSSLAFLQGRLGFRKLWSSSGSDATTSIRANKLLSMAETLQGVMPPELLYALMVLMPATCSSTQHQSLGITDWMVLLSAWHNEPRRIARKTRPWWSSTVRRPIDVYYFYQYVAATFYDVHHRLTTETATTIGEEAEAARYPFADLVDLVQQAASAQNALERLSHALQCAKTLLENETEAKGVLRLEAPKVATPSSSSSSSAVGASLFGLVPMEVDETGNAESALESVAEQLAQVLDKLFPGLAASKVQLMQWSKTLPDLLSSHAGSRDRASLPPVPVDERSGSAPAQLVNWFCWPAFVVYTLCMYSFALVSATDNQMTPLLQRIQQRYLGISEARRNEVSLQLQLRVQQLQQQQQGSVSVLEDEIRHLRQRQQWLTDRFQVDAALDSPFQWVRGQHPVVVLESLSPRETHWMWRDKERPAESPVHRANDWSHVTIAPISLPTLPPSPAKVEEKRPVKEMGPGLTAILLGHNDELAQLFFPGPELKQQQQPPPSSPGKRGVKRPSESRLIAPPALPAGRAGILELRKEELDLLGPEPKRVRVFGPPQLRPFILPSVRLPTVPGSAASVAPVVAEPVSVPVTQQQQQPDVSMSTAVPELSFAEWAGFT